MALPVLFFLSDSAPTIAVSIAFSADVSCPRLAPSPFLTIIPALARREFIKSSALTKHILTNIFCSSAGVNFVVVSMSPP